MSRAVPYGRRVAELAARHPDRLAFAFAAQDGSERLVSWRELDERSNQVARLLDARGVGEGTLVVVALPNTPEHFFATHGAWKAGASVVPLRSDLPEWERERILDIADPAAVVSEWMPGALRVHVSPADLAATATTPAAPLGDRVPMYSRLITTSGSTGTPKLIATPTPGLYDPDADGGSMVAVGEDLLQLVTSPLYHTNGFNCHVKLFTGSRLVVMERFDAARAVELIERWRINHVILVPTMLQRIAALPGIEDRDLTSLESVFYGGASLSLGVARAWLGLVEPGRFWFQYGGSEGLGATMTSGVEWLEHPGTAGRPLGCDVRIAGDHGQILPTGEIGDILMRPHGGPSTFRYIGAPTPEPDADGYLSYGDLGWLDDDGYLFIADRRVDMIVTGGANVYPAEVEMALIDHPRVADVVVIGLPDEQWGHRIHALVEPADASAGVDVDELRTFLKQRIASYKVPKTFEVVEAMPRTTAGKINRSTLVLQRQDATAGSTEL
jgi:bile acid-coenzyme A ligase